MRFDRIDLSGLSKITMHTRTKHRLQQPHFLASEFEECLAALHRPRKDITGAELFANTAKVNITEKQIDELFAKR
jgi:hypothetical protein